MILVSDSQACLDPLVAPSSVDPPLTFPLCERTAAHPFDVNLTSLSCERTAAHTSDVNLTSLSREHTAAHSFDATLPPLTTSRLAKSNRTPVMTLPRLSSVQITPPL